MKLPLLDYQQEGVQFMYANKKCMNLDDPGLGKTPQAIALMEKLEGKSILVVKAENILQWKEELNRFTDTEFLYVEGNSASRRRKYEIFSNSSSKILLINYEKLIYDAANIFRLLPYCEAIIFDEAFALKNPKSKVHKVALHITERLDRVVLMTATPMGSHLYDFYNLFKFLHLPDLMDEQEFINHHLSVENIGVNVGLNHYLRMNYIAGSKRIPEFLKYARKYFIKRFNDDKLDGIGINIHKHALPLSPEQNLACAIIKDNYERQGLTGIPLSTIKAYSEFAKIVFSPSLVDSSFSDFSPKVETLINYLKSTNEQVVVFAKYLEAHEILHKYFKKEGITYASFTGKQTLKQKNAAKHKFTNGGVRVLLVTHAGKEGLNLQSSNVLFMLDVPTTPSEVFQLIGRVYRIGQTKDVDVHFLYHTNSVEEDRFASLIRRQGEVDVLFRQNKASMFLGFPNTARKTSFLKRDFLADIEN